jgi:UDP-N-acetylmuramyl pentapeptide phosphotransferase/UDP-N-acetylglucosamine-1-phosphate transferase
MAWMVTSAILAFVVAFCALRVILRWFARVALDEPNARSMHVRAVPRTGGIALLGGAALSLATGAAALWPLFTCAIGLAVLSFLDDMYGVAPALRLASHLAMACIGLWLLRLDEGPVALALLVVSVIWMANLYNFMDGSDGFAAGMATIGFGAYAVAAAADGHQPLACMSVALAAAAAAFLLHNFHPARIFLGDVGAVPLGFLAAALGLVGWRDDVWPLWFPLLVFGTFSADATITLLRRLARRERPWQAHRDHYYQRMARMGLGHRGTAFMGYALMLVCAVAALFARTEPPPVQAAAFGLATAVLAAAALWVDVRWTRFVRSGS